MPRVTVNFYSSLRGLAATPFQVFHVENESTVQDLLNVVYSQHPVMVPFASSLLLARNGDYCQASDKLKEGDVVDLMPPVSGG
ncbi:MAG: MoaD/ThiS family protein [Candidatus Sumerlaeaceae bacterium]|nr:MoaD/ThiS family protein [Candidatus Sumerlaeaceae bacterium]